MDKNDLSNSPQLWMLIGIILGVGLTLSPVFLIRHKDDLLTTWFIAVCLAFVFNRVLLIRGDVHSPTFNFYRGFILASIAVIPLLFVWWPQ
jgi:FtsH-binding integral membrane protein